LGATVRLASQDGIVLTGQLSSQSHPWLADHVIAGSVLLPGTAFIELALRTGADAGCEQLDELTLERPLTLPETGAGAVQTAVPAPAPAGRRGASTHSRTDGAWPRHASGVLAPVAAPAPALAEWPPADAEPVDLTGRYEQLAATGFAYGPVFQGLRSLWRSG